MLAFEGGGAMVEKTTDGLYLTSHGQFCHETDYLSLLWISKK